ncbi:hypothetical protein [Paenibacillus sp. WLX2291]|uniref:hypothetical protein n=1 Tax=Paenibacillus sp. WLX2291 TaxID=3296934 RepID=UPI0039843B0C
MIGFLGAMITIGFIVYLVLAIRSRKKGSPKAKQQFRIMWILLGGVILLTIIDPNKGQTARITKPEQAATTHEVAEAEPAQDATSTNAGQLSELNDDQQATSSTTEIASDPAKSTEGKENIYVETKQTLDKEAVLTYAGMLRGSPFIKDVNVGKNDISIAYFSSFKQYKAANPQSQATQSIYDDYFSTGDIIKKILMEESTRLLKEFPAANEIKMTVPFNGETYSIDLKEDEAKKFYGGVDFDTLKTSDPSDGNSQWRVQISDKYFNDADRKRFVDEFLKVN